jgi:cytochrome c oxidase subunit II
MSRTVLLLGLALVVVYSTGSSGQQSRRVIEITAERFEFWPSEITVDVGEEVELRVTSEDTIHGLRIQGTEINLTVPKRGKGSVVATFKASAPGRFLFECSRMCGAGHHFMSGELVVRDPAAGVTR